MDRRLFPPEFIRLLDETAPAALRVRHSHRAGRHHTASPGDSQEFQDFRAYTPGDDLRFLDWNIFRRSRKLFLRRYRAFPEVAHTVGLDASGSVRFSEKRAFTAWRLAALLAGQLLNGGDRVRLEIGSGHGKVYHPGRDSHWEICEALSAAFADRSDDAPLELQRRGRSRHWLISDFYDNAGLGHLEKRLRQAAFIPVRIWDAEEYAPELCRQSCLVDAENGGRITVTDEAALLRRYRQEMLRFETLLDQVGQRAGQRLFRLETSVSVEALYAAYRREFAPEGC